MDELRRLENEVFGLTENSCLFYMRLLKESQDEEDTCLCINDKRRKKRLF